MLDFGLCVFAGFAIMIAWGDGFIRGRKRGREMRARDLARVDRLIRRAEELKSSFGQLMGRFPR